MQNKCDEYKNRITEIFDSLNSNSNVSSNDINNSIMLINEMYNFAKQNNLIKNTKNPSAIDINLTKQMTQSLKDENLSADDKIYLMEIFKQLFLDQMHVLYIIICKPIMEKPLDKLIIKKKIVLNEAKQYIKKNNLFTDGIPFRKLSGGNLILLNMSKGYYKAYKNLYLLNIEY
jgi:hypothetical protein